MMGLLDRFSIDLDFDMPDTKDQSVIQKSLEKIFKDLGLEIKDHSRNVPQYFLKYEAKLHERNTLKIDITTDPPVSNKYEPIRIIEIDRIIDCQTIETMFANKLVALIERYEKNNSIAGRDLYDIHHFFLQGFKYDIDVIRERRGKDVVEFFIDLIRFIEKNITEKTISQDLNSLLSYDNFRRIRKTLKQETLMLLRDEAKRIKKA